MKIVIIGPGIMPIPPIGWGAVEILIWDSKNALESLGHDVKIINTQNPNEILKEIHDYDPDFVHIQYDDFIQLYPYIRYPCAITSHFGYLEQPNRWDYYGDRVAKPFSKIKPNIFCLSEGIKNVYRDNLSIPEDKLFITPNGVNSNQFLFKEVPNYPDRSIFLAKIDYRKRQYMFQSINSLWYAGNIVDPRFDVTKNYLGEWTKEHLYSELTNYGNLVLLSDGEAHPLVCTEALTAGLGIVISEWSTANLDLSRKFITVIPENRIDDIEFIESEIIKNREYSVSNRKEIFEYSKEFDWKNIIEKFYIPNMEQIIQNRKTKVAICFIGTSNYLNFLPKYYENINQYFLPECEKTFLVCTDGELEQMPDNMVLIHQDHMEWPFITLKRFEIINHLKPEIAKHDWFVFIDADALVVDTITEKEFFDCDKSFFGVHHPCHYLKMNGHESFPGSFETNVKSRAAVKESDDLSVYYQGCLWGGKVPDIFELIDTLSDRIQQDLNDNVIAIWHDESHINKFFIDNKDRVHTLDSSYAYPEDFSDMCSFSPKIVHLSKNNSKYHI